MFDLATVVKPLSLDQNNEMSTASFKRILEAESKSFIRSVHVLLTVYFGTRVLHQ